MMKSFSFIAILTVLLGLNSCETEFSLNGDYKPIPIVFGLLDHQDTIHMIKITKAFLGDDDNLVYAKIPDSSYFAQVDAQIIEYNKEGKKTNRVWQLRDSVIQNKDVNGIFYGPDQKIYYFVEPDLNTEYTYQIVGDINEGEHSFSAETELIDGFSVPNTVNLSNKVSFAKNTVDEDKDYITWIINITPGENTAKFETSYTFHWTEHYVNGDSAKFSLTRNSGEETDMSKPVRVSGLDFYQWIQSEIPTDDNVVTRTADGFDLHISLAHSNLLQYMEVSKPVSGIAQIQPVFTNIEGGYGLFSSRHLFHLKGRELDASSIKELASGQYTILKTFCSRNPLHASESYACP